MDCTAGRRRSTKDELLLNVSVYWLTNTIGSSIRLYRESVDDDGAVGAEPDVPAAHLISRRGMFPTAREWMARTSRIDRRTEIDRRDRFLEWEEPDLVAADMQCVRVRDAHLNWRYGG
jgi:hypothetical protein